MIVMELGWVELEEEDQKADEGRERKVNERVGQKEQVCCCGRECWSSLAVRVCTMEPEYKGVILAIPQLGRDMHGPLNNVAAFGGRESSQSRNQARCWNRSLATLLFTGY